ncbi:uncharacterized protein KNAG_0A05950 [Huiozyma naganishii CBS 8797]|uniref:Uncharacterized protein n=1 Tax=Huiozyma naganishii (strain ATCC MYA-139 / BCRC 22969 / CBS 8797 / KCTC 17520 / NBRC 10181 / NCYC 3082 / Yp74L-3) TaxID=1071383 RepID=J7RTY9_HUIN7|nr:hypothetical protein KNAG_0A05950 [Kazachstania naganishii CBS 8797]CCK68257.1 hypothetical protein KNAG_0A05950 [Kazachstania naganishii CBS 8797]
MKFTLSTAFIIVATSYLTSATTVDFDGALVTAAGPVPSKSAVNAQDLNNGYILELPSSIKSTYTPLSLTESTTGTTNRNVQQSTIAGIEGVSSAGSSIGLGNRADVSSVSVISPSTSHIAVSYPSSMISSRSSTSFMERMSSASTSASSASSSDNNTQSSRGGSNTLHATIYGHCLLILASLLL